MLLVHIKIIIIFSCHFLLIKSEQNLSLHWILLHYHKTGNYLSSTLTKPFKYKNISIYSDHLHRRSKFDFTFYENWANNNVNNIEHKEDEYRIIISHGGNFFFNWFNELLNKNNNKKHSLVNGKVLNYYVAHMVRDPYDMILSGLLYHSQEKMPEGWLGRKINPCLSNNRDMNEILMIISKHPGQSLLTLHNYIRNITSKCQEIYHQHGIGSYHHTLRGMMINGEYEKAIKLEASRTILSGVCDF